MSKDIFFVHKIYNFILLQYCHCCLHCPQAEKKNTIYIINFDKRYQGIYLLIILKQLLWNLSYENHITMQPIK